MFQVVTLQEAKALLKEDDDLIISVYDYWLNKRLRMVSDVKSACTCQTKTLSLMSHAPVERSELGCFLQAWCSHCRYVLPMQSTSDLLGWGDFPQPNFQL